ncbi:hypothetical protein GUJ93_ZPchr0010g7740 [Zizania palustris]|uniref:Remorin C-terminal domain-containing protein n=1 Tax=Zizania palustris TaxID=103762 RepID=A0A8J5WC27_ZIZPA|nr:hypothetical protein GUJ93_ZPchr0010g7740 [Zizania palustris]
MLLGGEVGVGFQGGGGCGDDVRGGKMVRRGWKREEAAGGDGGCSASSTTGGGSSLCDSPLPSFVLQRGGPGSDLELDGLLTCSSNASSGSREEDHGALHGVKEEGWIQLQRPVKNPAPRSTTGECQDPRYRLGSVLFHGRNEREQRPASFDFGCPSAEKSSTHSPGFLVRGVGVMNKGLGVLTCPGTPSYNRQGTRVAGYQKGWKRHQSNTMVLPHNTGRTLPSKWEDAERWISSPNPSNNALGRTSLPQPQRANAKSGPLGPHGRIGEPYSFASSSSSSSLLDTGRTGNRMVNPPFLAGVVLPGNLCGGSSSHTGRVLSGTSCEDSSNGLGGRSGGANDGNPTCQESTRACTDEQTDITKDSATSRKSAILRKDVATQTSPEQSRSTSPSRRHSFSCSLSVQQVKELESCFSKLEIKGVQMDDRVTLTRWSKKHATQGSEKNSTNIIQLKKRSMESKSSAWAVAGTAKCISKIEGEEANITAWENMQKAKAEAAIEKLVMKLERKRLYSLERIFNTLRSSNRKTHVTRTTTTNLDQHISRTVKRTLHLGKNGQMSSLSGCFSCHAF